MPEAFIPAKLPVVVEVDISTIARIQRDAPVSLEEAIIILTTAVIGAQAAVYLETVILVPPAAAELSAAVRVTALLPAAEVHRQRVVLLQEAVVINSCPHLSGNTL